MIGDALNWISRQDPMHVFYGVSALLMYCVLISYRLECR